MGNRLQQFGGSWTEQKLEVLAKYLNAYTTALKDKPFKLFYIDAFAGTGYREAKEQYSDQQLMLEGFGAAEQRFLDGSAKIALELERPFDRYLFIEENVEKYEQLCKLTNAYKTLQDRVCCQNGDSNDLLIDFCQNGFWNNWRAVLFLDPFGMNVKWDTMKIISNTHAIDVWVLFPLGSAVNRLLKRDGSKISESWKRKLNEMFGTNEWFDRFYEHKIRVDLFDCVEHTEKTGNFSAIAEFYLERLKTIFAGVAENPKLMYNSRNNPLFMFCFAMGNPSESARKLALRIAKNILNKV